MKKILISLTAFASISYAALINAIAVTINDIPVTLYDIDKEMTEKRVSKKDAVESIFDTILYDQEVKKYGISVDIFDINSYIDKLAAANKMNTLDFKNVIRQQQDYDAFVEKVKQQLIHEKLVQRIAQGNIKLATEEDMKRFYENNIEKYSLADSIEVIAYVSNDKNALIQIQRNPMSEIQNVLKQNITLKQGEMNSQVKYLLNNTKEKSFSVIFPQNKAYNMFYVVNKKEVKAEEYESVKTKIFNEMMLQREQSYLKEYFETLKITAKIDIKR